MDIPNFKIDELSFIEYRLGLINSGFDSIEDSIKSYFNGLCFEINIKELMWLDFLYERPDSFKLAQNSNLSGFSSLIY